MYSVHKGGPDGQLSMSNFSNPIPCLTKIHKPFVTRRYNHSLPPAYTKCIICCIGTYHNPEPIARDLSIVYNKD